MILTGHPADRAHFHNEGAGRFRLEGEVGFGTVMHLLHESHGLFEHEKRVRLDLSGVERINSAGLALVIEWMREAHHGGWTLEISNPPEELLAVARICDVEHLLQDVLTQPSQTPSLFAAGDSADR